MPSPTLVREKGSLQRSCLAFLGWYLKTWQEVQASEVVLLTMTATAWIAQLKAGLDPAHH